MRKNMKRKRRSCAMCKGNKMGWWSRWPGREEVRLREAERDIREALRR